MNDELKAPDPYSAVRQDMPRIRYDGAYRIDMVPLIWGGRPKESFKSYPSIKGNKAIALRLAPSFMSVAVGAKSAAAAEKQALEGCNGKVDSPFPCFLYAVNDRVVLPQRRTEPRQ